MMTLLMAMTVTVTLAVVLAITSAVGAASTEEEFDKISPTCRFDDNDNTCGSTFGVDPKFSGNVEVSSWGVPQQVTGTKSVGTQKILLRTRDYMRRVMADDDEAGDAKYASVRDDCKLRNKLCAFWAALGECEANPAYMAIQCAPACESCEQISFEHRCPVNETDPGVWYQEGQLNDMFDRIVSEQVLQQQRRGEALPGDPEEEEASSSVTVLSYDPWIVQIDNFATEEECQRLIELGAELGYKRSEDVGDTNFDGTIKGVQSEARTSENAWCTDQCHTDPLTRAVVQRMESLTGIPSTNYEYLQLLRYEEGQYYKPHHDYIDLDNQRPPGVRILTIFLYLNDVPSGENGESGGGGTNFVSQNITVTPQRGRIVMWPSVFDGKPTVKDGRTQHQALPVIHGVKYGANAWVHQKDFKTPHTKGCA